MNNEVTKVWDGSVFGTGPIYVLVDPQVPPTSEPARIVVGAADNVVAVAVEQFPAFLEIHKSEICISPDSTRLFDVVANHPHSVMAVMQKATEGRWVDLGLLDLLARIATGESCVKVRTPEELVANRVQHANQTGENPSESSPFPYQNLSDRHRMGRLREVHRNLKELAERLANEAASPQNAEYRLSSFSPEREDDVKRQSKAFVRELVEQQKTRTQIETGPQHPRRPRPVTNAPSDQVFKSDRSPSPTGRTRSDRGNVAPDMLPLGLGSRVRGSLAIKAMSVQPDSFRDRVERARLSDLRERVEDRYQYACGKLKSSEEAHKCFHWDGEIVVRKQNGHIRDTKAMRGWLPRAAGRLVDRLNLPAPIPRTPDGSPTSNPEHWGHWLACDRSLWSWRELRRMAEILRFTSAAVPLTPRYELFPHLRSFEPNLAVYRQLGVPLFRPRPKHILLAGRIPDLRLRCFTALGLQRSYFSRGSSRLAGYFLPRENPVATVAGELYVANALRCSDLASEENSGPNRGKGNDDEIGSDRESRRRAAERRYATLQQDAPLEAEAWLRRTEGLLAAAILGIPESSLGVFLECEYQDAGIGSLEASHLMRLLTSEVVTELRVCLEDRTTGIVWAQRGRSAQDEMIHRANSAYPETYSAQVRNSLQRSGIASLNLKPDLHPAHAVGDRPPSDSEAGTQPFLVRGKSLGGRITARGSQAVVLHQEVLQSADEVVLEVAFALLAGGYCLLGIAGNEFVVEVPEHDAAKDQSRITELAISGAARILGRWANAVTLERCDRW
ncbi:MAG: hypothetical protein K8U57_00640 [Planctomycetes bacterium]|nr:hypothetical protein [Planctomycetota bacterium]